MTYTGPTVLPGISGQVLSNIPEKWSAAWFRQFCLNHLQYADARNANAGSNISISGKVGQPATISGTTVDSANPSAEVGLAAVDGSATTFMTSDSAPALNQAISPTWTGSHTFNGDVGFYGTTPVTQRASTSVQYVSNLSTVTSSASFGTAQAAALNQLEASLGEVMHTLAYYGLWSIS